MTAAKQNVTRNSAEEVPETTKVPMGLKILVVVLGLAILGMLGLIIYKVLAGGQKTPTTAAPNVLAAPTSNAASFSDMDVKRPVGSLLVEVTTNSHEIMLHFSGADGDTLIFIDRTKGTKHSISIPK